MIPREDLIDALVTYVACRAPKLKSKLSKRLIRQTNDASPYLSGTEWEAIDRLSDESRELYWWVVAKRDGVKIAHELRRNYERIQAVDGVTIVVEDSDDDPTQIIFTIRDVIADAWADAHGSLDGGTWETADGTDFVYDITYWRPGLLEELVKDGYKFDFSQYSEPDERDVEIALHASECKECEYDWHSAEKHMNMPAIIEAANQAARMK